VRGELDAEQVAHLAIEVGKAGLGPAENTDLDIALTAEPLRENAQRDRLAGAGRAGDVAGVGAAAAEAEETGSSERRRPLAFWVLSCG